MLNSGIYKIRNILNDNFYIGSALDFDDRWKAHLYMLRNNKHVNLKLQASYNKNGEDVFKFEKFIFCSKEVRFDLEQLCLDELKPYYNISLSARGGATKTKPIDQYSYEGVFMMTWDSMKKACETLGIQKECIRRCFKAESFSAGGFRWAERGKELSNFIRKPRQKKQKQVKSKRKFCHEDDKILQYDLEGNFIKEWKNAYEIAKQLKIGSAMILNCCKGKISKCKGFKWKFKNLVFPEYTPKNKRKIDQYTKDNIFIKTWDNIKEAANNVKVSPNSITQCARNRTKTSAGFIWKYHDYINVN